MTPRPILKHFPPHSLSLYPDPSEDYTSCPDFFTPYSGALPFSSSRNIPPLESPHVHFPPTPILTKMGMTHSSYSYDRHPIEVLPNSLALPQRGTREIDEPMDESAPMENCDDGYFQPSEHVHAISDVESLASNTTSIFFESENVATSSHSVEMIPFENIQNHSRNFGDVYSHNTHPSFVRDSSPDSLSERYSSQPTNELSASISISIHFSRLSDQSLTSPSSLMRKRDLGECHFEHGKRPKAHGKHSPTKPQKYFHEDDTSTELDDPTNLSSRISSSPACNGYDLGLERVLNRTKHSMDTIMNNSSSSSGCDSAFASFCDPGLEGCLGGF